jgi:undecaprenyl-diphosphatase
LILPPRAASLGALLLAISVVIAALVTFVGAPPFDDDLVRHAASLRDGWIGAVMDLASEVGWARWMIPLVAVVAVFLGAIRRRWRAALCVALSTPVASTVSRVLKESFERTRPAGGVDPLIAGFSMPSGHATATAAFAVSALVVTTQPRLRRVAVVVLPVFSLLVGVSRGVLGAHYPRDVIAGWCVGAGVALLVAVACSSLPRRNVEEITS